MNDTILIVDDEASVRQTFAEWLRQDLPEMEVLVAADAEAALTTANQRQIDVAILDWNLGAGSHGLQLLEDLHVFQPDLVAILVTGYADKATPLDALRLGVRDYFDKNQRLTKEKLVLAIRKQLEKLRPLKRERLVQRQLQAFRAAVEKALPLVQTAADLRDSVPLVETVRALFRVLQQGTGAGSGMLVLRTMVEQKSPEERLLLLDMTGRAIPSSSFRYAQSLAAVVAFQQPQALRADLGQLRKQAGLQLLEAEATRRHVLSQAITLGPTTMAVVELFDRAERETVVPFTAANQEFLHATMPLLALSLKRTFQEQETHALLLDALGQALHTTQQMDQSLQALPSGEMFPSVPPGQEHSLVSSIPRQDFRQLAVQLERLAEKHGSAAIHYCMQLLTETERLLDAATGLGEG